MEVDLDDAARKEIVEIIMLLRHDAVHAVRKKDRKINHALDEKRPVAILLIWTKLIYTS